MKKETESEFKSELIKLSIVELNKLEKEWLEESRKARFEEIVGSLDNLAKKRAIKKRIAMIKTILHEYNLGIRKREEDKVYYIDKCSGREYELTSG